MKFRHSRGICRVLQGCVIMAEKKEYRSAVRSRRLINQAFLELLREKPFEILQLPILSTGRISTVPLSTPIILMSGDWWTH